MSKRYLNNILYLSCKKNKWSNTLTAKDIPFSIKTVKSFSNEMTYGNKLESGANPEDFINSLAVWELNNDF